jgi:hypothetical protein
VLLDAADPGRASQLHRGGYRFEMVARSSALLRLRPR